jgi:hypothetical protein
MVAHAIIACERFLIFTADDHAHYAFFASKMILNADGHLSSKPYSFGGPTCPAERRKWLEGRVPSKWPLPCGHCSTKGRCNCGYALQKWRLQQQQLSETDYAKVPQAPTPLLIPPLNQPAHLLAARAPGENAENAQDEGAQGPRMPEQRKTTEGPSGAVGGQVKRQPVIVRPTTFMERRSSA